MVISEFHKPFVAISYDTATYFDLHEYMKEENIELSRIEPGQPLDQNFQYINLVIQDLELRKKISQQLDDYTRFSYIHPSSVIGKTTNIGRGVFVYPMCTIYNNTELENDVVLHGNGFIAHYVRIKKGTFMSASTTVGGSTTLGNFCFLGIGATVADKISVCDNAYIGAGAVVVKDINLAGTYIGVPAKEKGRMVT